LNGLPFHSISEEETEWVDGTFEESEVFEVAKHMNGEKTPGPDGFSMQFLQPCRNVVKIDVMKVFLEFH
jgi:hypothetical protein